MSRKNPKLIHEPCILLEDEQIVYAETFSTRSILIYIMHSDFDSFFSGKPVQQIDFFYLLRQIGHQQIDVILRNAQIAVSKHFGKRNDIAPIENPLLGKGMPVPMNACRFNASALIVACQHFIVRRSPQLLPIGIAKQELVLFLVLTMSQILAQNALHGFVDRNNQRLSALRHANMNQAVFKINVADPDMNQAPLPDSCTE